MLTQEQKTRVCHSKLVTETTSLVHVSRNFVDMGMGGSYLANVDEAKGKIKSVISGLQYLLEEMENL